MNDYAEKLVSEIDALSKAITYLADVIGYKTDDKNPTVNGKAVVTLRAEGKEKTYTIEEIKAALNKFASSNGKTKTMKLVKSYAKSHNPDDIPEDEYPRIMAEIS